MRIVLPLSSVRNILMGWQYWYKTSIWAPAVVFLTFIAPGLLFMVLFSVMECAAVSQGYSGSVSALPICRAEMLDARAVYIAIGMVAAFLAAGLVNLKKDYRGGYRTRLRANFDLYYGGVAMAGSIVGIVIGSIVLLYGAAFTIGMALIGIVLVWICDVFGRAVM